jgi:hypothetical protein
MASKRSAFYLHRRQQQHPVILRNNLQQPVRVWANAPVSATVVMTCCLL